MNPFGDMPEGLPEELLKKIEDLNQTMQWEEQGHKIVGKAITESQKKIEEILFAFWDYLGNNTSTYQTAFAVVHIYDKLVRKTRDEVYGKVPSAHIPEFFRSMGNMCHVISGMHQEAIDARNRHEKNAPPVVKKALKEKLLDDEV